MPLNLAALIPGRRAPAQPTDGAAPAAGADSLDCSAVSLGRRIDGGSWGYTHVAEDGPDAAPAAGSSTTAPAALSHCTRSPSGSSLGPSSSSSRQRCTTGRSPVGLQGAIRFNSSPAAVSFLGPGPGPTAAPPVARSPLVRQAAPAAAPEGEGGAAGGVRYPGVRLDMGTLGIAAADWAQQAQPEEQRAGSRLSLRGLLRPRAQPVQGCVVLGAVHPGGACAAAGVRPGVLTHIDDVPVSSVADLSAAIAAIRSQGRQEAAFTVLPMPESEIGYADG
eukprot:TRINITY_DN16760_c0_g1_i1.p1 TRINITY_DN16760_c0_g1~~TRINITY_DN16760_c0_g1_i1.p1  ORF type:complete len:302 (+),score=42.32 TRINITY_DN16760_c0_g1_i1:77-907(+)